MNQYPRSVWENMAYEFFHEFFNLNLAYYKTVSHVGTQSEIQVHIPPQYSSLNFTYIIIQSYQHASSSMQLKATFMWDGDACYFANTFTNKFSFLDNQ